MTNLNATDIGVVMIELDNSIRTSNILTTIGKLSKNLPYNQVCVFNSYSEVIDNHKIPILHIAQCKFFRGQLIVFDLASLLIAQNCPNVTKIILYAKDLLWKKSGLSYKDLNNILTNPNIEIITSNQALYDLFEIVWKKPLGVSKDFDYETIQQFI